MEGPFKDSFNDDSSILRQEHTVYRHLNGKLSIEKYIRIHQHGDYHDSVEFIPLL